MPKVSPPTQFRGVTEYSIGEDGICKAQQRQDERRFGQCSTAADIGQDAGADTLATHRRDRRFSSQSL